MGHRDKRKLEVVHDKFIDICDRTQANNVFHEVQIHTGREGNTM